AANALRKNGDTKTLRAALAGIPRDFNPGGCVTTVAVRLALMDLDYEEAERVINSSGSSEFNDGGIGGIAATLDGYVFPKAWYEGLIARGRGDKAGAARAFQAARRAVENDAR